ncbi:MAG: dynamin family protein [Kangiellaceae bacterium]
MSHKFTDDSTIEKAASRIKQELSSKVAQQSFSNNIDQFSQWKKEVAKSLSRFRLWLRRNDLFNDDVDKRLCHLQESLKRENLTIAFVGEFSRGKTELINSLFFSEYDQRILPSDIGRTTMCPTELFFDKKENRAYLRLLPIETRLEETTLEEFRKIPNLWTEVPLMTDSAQEMSRALFTITQTKKVTLQDAVNLGFDESLLIKELDKDGLVEIPAWRHALVSFTHHLLKQGLCILDTPGLNALGSEPELTLKIIPQVQAVVFLLSADTGVTASDMEIWEKCIQNTGSSSDSEHTNLQDTYAVLNKVDTLWDELSSKKKIEKAIKKMTDLTARQLQIDPRNVLPVSAQKGLLAKVKNNKSLYAKSHMGELESILSESLLANKESMITQSVIEDAQSLIHESLQIINNKNDQLHKQQKELGDLTHSNKDKMKGIIEDSKVALETFKKKSLSVKPSQRLLERQTQILLSVIGSKAVANEIESTLDELVNSKTTLGLFKRMKLFFVAVKSLMSELEREAELTNKMAKSLYTKFTTDFDVVLVEPRSIPIKKLNNKLNKIIARSEKLENSLFMTFSEHSLVVKRFFSGTVTDIMNFFKSSRTELMNWTQNVATPLTQQLKIHHHMMMTHHEELEKLHKKGLNAEGQLKGIKKLIDELEMERENALQISHQLYNNQLIQKTKLSSSELTDSDTKIRNNITQFRSNKTSNSN